MSFRSSRYLIIYFHSNAEARSSGRTRWPRLCSYRREMTGTHALWTSKSQDLGLCRWFCRYMYDQFQARKLIRAPRDVEVHVLAVEYPGYGVRRLYSESSWWRGVPRAANSRGGDGQRACRPPVRPQGLLASWWAFDAQALKLPLERILVRRQSSRPFNCLRLLDAAWGLGRQWTWPRGQAVECFKRRGPDAKSNRDNSFVHVSRFPVAGLVLVTPFMSVKEVLRSRVRHSNAH